MTAMMKSNSIPPKVLQTLLTEIQPLYSGKRCKISTSHGFDVEFILKWEPENPEPQVNGLFKMMPSKKLDKISKRLCQFIDWRHSSELINTGCQEIRKSWQYKMFKKEIKSLEKQIATYKTKYEFDLLEILGN